MYEYIFPTHPTGMAGRSLGGRLPEGRSLGGRLSGESLGDRLPEGRGGGGGVPWRQAAGGESW